MSLFSFAYAREYTKERGIARGEYYILGLFSVLGMSVMASANSLLSIYLGLELLSLPLYAMVASYKTSEAATEAAIEIFCHGRFSFCLLLYGISIIYGLTGSIELTTIAQKLQSAPSPTVMLALVFIVCGLIFKFGAVPFHMWVPDVIKAHRPLSRFLLQSAPKIAAFGITFRILTEAFPDFHVAWNNF